MKYSMNQVTHGFLRYADNEIIDKLPTSGKWVLGTGIAMATKRIETIIEEMKTNSLLHTIGAVDEEGFFDVDEIATNLQETASKYGKMNLQIPLVGKLTFSIADVDTLKKYIERAEDDE